MRSTPLLACTVAVTVGLAPWPALANGVDSLPEPVVLRSSTGRLVVDLVAAPGGHVLGGRRFEGMLYNGHYLPELWRLRPGDELVVRFRNQLPEMTNLHFHGLNVSPRANADNIFIHVLPGESFTYRVQIPSGQHPGLFWYHPHAHGRSSPQIIAGLSGGLIVEGANRFYPFLEKLRERVLLIKHIPDPTPDLIELVSINGAVDPTIAIRPGEAQFWRIGNVGADLFLKLQIEGMPFFLIGTDGHHLARPRRLDELLLGPGQRAEVIVVGGDPGAHPFRSESFILEEGRPALPQRLLGRVVSEGPAADVAASQRRIEAQSVQTGRFIDALRRAPITGRRTFTFSRTEDRQKFFINGQQFDASRTDVTVTLGATEEWTLRNEDNQLHNFHIHQTDFLVTEVNGKPVEMDSLRDTFTLPPARNGQPGEVKVVIPFVDPTIVGRFVFHCHVVKHEDKGMMQTLEVRPL